jgi:hypothetical protein
MTQCTSRLHFPLASKKSKCKPQKWTLHPRRPPSVIVQKMVGPFSASTTPAQLTTDHHTALHRQRQVETPAVRGLAELFSFVLETFLVLQELGWKYM